MERESFFLVSFFSLKKWLHVLIARLGGPFLLPPSRTRGLSVVQLLSCAAAASGSAPVARERERERERKREKEIFDLESKTTSDRASSIALVSVPFSRFRSLAFVPAAWTRETRTVSSEALAFLSGAKHRKRTSGEQNSSTGTRLDDDLFATTSRNLVSSPSPPLLSSPSPPLFSLSSSLLPLLLSSPSPSLLPSHVA